MHEKSSSSNEQLTLILFSETFPSELKNQESFGL